MGVNGERVRWGVISTARINRKFLRGARAAAGVEVLAVASRDADRARRYADEQAIPRAYGSYEELLADPEVDALYISLPNALHVPWTLRGIEAGKHVLCEKPLARHGAEAERVVALAQERGVLVGEAFMYRHHPQIRRLSELVAAGEIGELRAVRAHFSFHMQAEGDVRLSTALQGGALMDIGCYCVSAARLLAGEPELVAATQVLGGDGVDMRFAGILRFPRGVLGHFDAGFDFAPRSELEVIGADGTLLLHDPWHGVEPGITRWREDGRAQIEIEPADPYRLEAENFAAAVRGRARLLVDGQEAIAQALTLEALYDAAASGRSVRPGSDRG